MRTALCSIILVFLAAVVADAGPQQAAAGGRSTQPDAKAHSSRAIKSTGEKKDSTSQRKPTLSGSGLNGSNRSGSNLSGLSLENPESTDWALGREEGIKENPRAAAPADAEISEFHAAAPGSGSSGNPSAMRSKKQKGSALKSIHGEVDGALGSDTQAASAAAGAASKSGGTYIYLETDHAKVSALR